jgi:hypothetical protein
MIHANIDYMLSATRIVFDGTHVKRETATATLEQENIDGKDT